MRNWHPTKTVSNEDKLAGYALFKQATIGDCNIPAPGMFNFTVQVVCACDAIGEGEVERADGGADGGGGEDDPEVRRRDRRGRTHEKAE